MPSRDSPRLGPTGTGAVRRAHSSGAADDAGVAEVVAHQALDPLPRLGAWVAETIRGPLLQVVAEHVVVAAGLEVQQRAHAQQEVFGVLEPRRVGRTAPEQ